jgi:hypothetical protein
MVAVLTTPGLPSTLCLLQHYCGNACRLYPDDHWQFEGDEGGYTSEPDMEDWAAQHKSIAQVIGLPSAMMQ